MKINIILFGASDICNQLRNYLRDDELSIVSSISNENQVLDEINRTSANIILFADTSTMALRSCNQVYLLRPRCIPVVIADNMDDELLKNIVQTGTHNILSSKTSAINLISEIKAIYSNEANRIKSLENTGGGSSKSKVVMVFGAKDGIGKTTFAVNLGIKLAQNKNRVVVLDYNMQFGDVSSYMGMHVKDTIIELLQEQSNPNVDTIRQFLSVHISGVNFLAAPFSPEDAKMVTSTQAERIISTLKVHFDYVIVDASSGFDDITAACMDCASNIMLLSGSDIPALTNTKKAISIIRALTDEDKISLVVCRMGDKSNNVAAISKALSMPVSYIINEERSIVMEAANQGTPLVLSAPNSKFAKTLGKVVQAIDASYKKTDRLGFTDKKKTSFFKRDR